MPRPRVPLVRWLALAAGVLLAAVALVWVSWRVAAPPRDLRPVAFSYQPLWPFASRDEADRWARDAPADGFAWHAESTALRFTRDYLGFSGVDQVTGTRIDGSEAWVSVGFVLPNNAVATAATLHLARFGSTADAPWEVVGSADDVLTIDTPSYGSAVGGRVIEAGGLVTGVDECLHLHARQHSRADTVGEFSCVPAGGERSRWSGRLPLRDTDPGVLTVVVSTGGHVATVERFAVTGLRVGPAAST